jgi:SulP family sulfate permease
VINAVILIPVLVAFAAIIFRNAGFQQDLPMLTKLVFFSSMCHQIIFTLRSSLPFAVGQVQDAGLIFLSSMATTIYVDLGGAVARDERVATVLVALAGGTALLGAALWAIGRRPRPPGAVKRP